jgi:hypothetical protein
MTPVTRQTGTPTGQPQPHHPTYHHLSEPRLMNHAAMTSKRKNPGPSESGPVNANGISTREGLADLHSLCISLRARSVDAVAIQEANTDFMQPAIREKYTAIFKEHFGQARVITATTCIHAPNTWKPGGAVFSYIGPLGPTRFKSVP